MEKDKLGKYYKKCHIAMLVSHKVDFLAKSKQINEGGYYVGREVLLESVITFYNPKEKQPSRKMGMGANRQFSEGADEHKHDHCHKQSGNVDQNHDVRLHPDQVSTYQGLTVWLRGAGVCWAHKLVHPLGRTV